MSLHGMQRNTSRWILVGFIGLSACWVDEVWHGPEAGEEGGDSGTSLEAGATKGLDGDAAPPEPSNKVDMIFVIDNSGSMSEEQELLSSSVSRFADLLVADSAIDWRLAVTTTDNDNPWCAGGSPESGDFVMSSCLDRLTEFIIEGPTGPTDTSPICESGCSLAKIDVVPTTTDLDSTPRPRPWLEFGPNHTNVTDDLGQVIRCMMPMGINGCGFEQPLESMHLAVLRSQDTLSANYGFIREDAHLVVVFVTDETDCSHTEEGEVIFIPANRAGNNPAALEAFWGPHPDATQATSAVCWNAGMACAQNLSGTLDCHVENFALDGTVTTDPESAVLHPVERYRSELEALRVAKAPFGGTVSVFGLVGVPIGFPEENIVHSTGYDDFHDNFGIAPGCVSGEARATPPGRLSDLVGRFGPIEQHLFSICESNYDAAVAQMFNPFMQFDN